MNITIVKGSMEYLKDCEAALAKSTLGEKYFAREGSARDAVLEGLENDGLYVALLDNACVGFFYLIPKGSFHSFPYLHIIAVKEECRGLGVGKILMDYAERIAFESANKIFLVVADFNPDGKKFYERNGYRQVGEIPDLYRPGIAECIMMKERE